MARICPAAVRGRGRDDGPGIRLRMFPGAGVLRGVALLDRIHAASLRRGQSHPGGRSACAAGGDHGAVFVSCDLGRGVYNRAPWPADRRDVADRVAGGGMATELFPDRLSLESARLYGLPQSPTD